MRWREHENIKTDSEPDRHLKANNKQPSDGECYYPHHLISITDAMKQPNLNNQTDSNLLYLFRYGVIQKF